MYLLAHLLAGILLGILLAYLFQDTRLIPACAFGSILPDLIDKPVGLLLLADTIGYGRIYCHTLLFTGLVLFIGILVYTRYPRIGILFLALTAGVLSHQVLDAMWLEPNNWYWPALGPFKGHHLQPDFLRDAFLRTIKNPTEWLAGGIILIILIIYSIPRYRAGSAEPGLRQISIPLLLFVIATVLLALVIGIRYR